MLSQRTLEQLETMHTDTDIVNRKIYLVYNCQDIYLKDKEMFYLTQHILIRLYCIRHLVKDHSMRGNPLPPHGLLFPINSKDYFKEGRKCFI